MNLRLGEKANPMPIAKLHSEFIKRDSLRRLLMVFVMLFAFYPIFDAAADAFSDHLTHPTQMSPDDNISSARHNHLDAVLCSRINNAGQKMRITSPQVLLQLSSDPSPPSI